MYTNRQTAIAGKPAPTFLIGVNLIWRANPIPCGSGLAREGGLSANTDAADPPLSQASQLPHF